MCGCHILRKTKRFSKKYKKLKQQQQKIIQLKEFLTDCSQNLVFESQH